MKYTSLSFLLLAWFACPTGPGRTAQGDNGSSQLPTRQICLSLERCEGGLMQHSLRAPSEEATMRRVQLCTETITPSSSSAHSQLEVIWEGALLQSPYGYSTLESARVGDDRAHVTTMHGGAERYLTCWTSGHDLSGQYMVQPLMIDKRSLIDTGSESGANTIVVSDLFDPQVFAWDNTIKLAGVAGAYNNSTLSTWAQAANAQDDPEFYKGYTVWIDDLPNAISADNSPEQTSTDASGHAVAPGLSPRFLASEGGVLLAVRAPVSFRESFGHAPVLFYRSEDLATWSLDDELSFAVDATDNYSIAWSHRGLSLVTTSAGEQACLELWRFDSDTGTWQPDVAIAGQQNAVDNRMERIWLFCTGEGAGADLEIIYDCAQGNATIIYQ